MTQYERQLRRIAQYPDRHTVLIQTPRLLMFVVDIDTPDAVTYTHTYDEAGHCTGAHWTRSRQ